MPKSVYFTSLRIENVAALALNKYWISQSTSDLRAGPSSSVITGSERPRSCRAWPGCVLGMMTRHCWLKRTNSLSVLYR